MNPDHDIAVLRELAQRYRTLAADPVQDKRRELWRAFHSLEKTDVPIYIMDAFNLWFWWSSRELRANAPVLCEDPLYRDCEDELSYRLFRATVGDDYVMEPWLAVPAVFDGYHGNNFWGVDLQTIRIPGAAFGFHIDPPIKNEEDLRRLVARTHRFDEETMRRNHARVQEAIGDILPVVVDRKPCMRSLEDIWFLRGDQQVLLDMYDNPALIHRLMAFMRDALLKVYREAEAAGDWNRLWNPFTNQSIPYARELPDPAAGVTAPMRSLWYYDCSQGFEGVSPDMFEEFMLQYQQPILEMFGLSAYGCCENLTKKIPHLKKIRNLRRIAVTPWADIRSCAEQLGPGYVISWRPNPAEMVCNGFHPERIAAIVKNAVGIFRANDCRFEINLKDFITVENDPGRLQQWVSVVRNTLRS